MSTVVRLSALMLSTLFVCACATDKSATRLEENLYAYQQAIRWSEYVRAAKFMHPDDRPSEQQLAFQISRLENLKIVGYRTLQDPQPGPEPGTTSQLVELRVVNKHTLAERIVKDQQLWRYDEEIERWWLISGLPKLGR